MFAGEMPPERPNFWRFLHQLQPSKSMQIECTTCVSFSSHNLIPADVPGICNHFRTVHVDALLHYVDRCSTKHRIDSAVESLMRRARYRGKVQEVLEGCSAKFEGDHSRPRAMKTVQYSRKKLPNLRALLQHLQSSDHGMIKCLRTACAKAPVFDPDMPSIVEHIWEHHCPHLNELAISQRHLIMEDIKSAVENDDQAFSRIKDLQELAENKWGLRTPSINGPRPPIRGANRAQCTHDNFYSFLKRQQQWTVLRELRGVFARRRSQLQSFAINEWTLNPFFVSTEDIGEALEAAVLAFHDITSGKPLATLKEVISFVNLLFSMAEVMKNRGRAVSFAPAACDFVVWRSHLDKVLDQYMFDKLVAGFWTEKITSTGRGKGKRVETAEADSDHFEAFQERRFLNKEPISVPGFQGTVPLPPSFDPEPASISTNSMTSLLNNAS